MVSLWSRRLQAYEFSVPYRFELREKIVPAFARITTEQIDRVLRDLTASKNGDVAVHESRKSLKRTRALLRLVRPGIGESAFKSNNAALRDIAQSFSADRDRHVLSGVASKCATQLGARFAKPFTAVQSTLDEMRTDPSAHAEARDRAIAALADARKSLQKLSPKPNSFDLLHDGLQDCYRRGRRQLKRAFAHPTDEGFHDLRKSVQQHWRHMQVLQRAWPDMFVARVAAARRLSQILGDDHDLAVFKTYVDAMAAAKISEAARRAIVHHCEGEQSKLRRLAQPLVQQLFAEKSGQFSRRIAVTWHTAVRLAEIEDANQQVSADKPPAKPRQKQKAPRKAPARSAKARRRGNSAQARPAT